MQFLRMPTAAVGLLLLSCVAYTPVFAQGNGKPGNNNGNPGNTTENPGNTNGNPGSAGGVITIISATPEVNSIVMLGSALAGGIGYLALRRRAARR